jgi:hypothetical protein
LHGMLRPLIQAMTGAGNGASHSGNRVAVAAK